MSSTQQQASGIKCATPEGAGHLLAEQAPEKMLTVPTELLATYREDGGGLR